jgi:hypothetical protein
MGRVGLLLCLAGCNQVFGLSETVAIDAQQFDAPPDAAFRCPPAGTPPMFATILHQAVTKNCISYTTSLGANRAAAFCLDIEAISDGAIDEVPERSIFTPPNAFDMPRLTPEGDEMWVRRRASNAATFAVYRYGGDHQWTWVRDLSIPSSSRDDLITTPSRSVGGVRRFLRLAFSELRLYEYTDDGATATLIRSYDASALAVTFISFPNLDADGQRLVFVGAELGSTKARTFYADRASLDVAFSPATVLVTAPVTSDPFLTEDCARLYTNGLGSIFYARQR